MADTPHDKEAEKRRILVLLGFNPDDPTMSVELVEPTDVTGTETGMQMLVNEVLAAVTAWDDVPPPASLQEVVELLCIYQHNLTLAGITRQPEEVRSTLINIASVAIWYVYNLIDRAK